MTEAFDVLHEQGNPVDARPLEEPSAGSCAGAVCARPPAEDTARLIGPVARPDGFAV
jgi:hypothetical protein